MGSGEWGVRQLLPLKKLRGQSNAGLTVFEIPNHLKLPEFYNGIKDDFITSSFCRPIKGVRTYSNRCCPYLKHAARSLHSLKRIQTKMKAQFTALLLLCLTASAMTV